MNEKLIEEAADAFDDAPPWMNRETALRFARAALAVFEKAHTPTDDEREALLAEADRWPAGLPDDPTPAASPHDLIARLASALRRPVVPEPSAAEWEQPDWESHYQRREPQGEPSFTEVLTGEHDGTCSGIGGQGEPPDAQVLAADDAMLAFRSGSQWDMIRAMLRAASAATEQGENRE